MNFEVSPPFFDELKVDLNLKQSKEKIKETIKFWLGKNGYSKLTNIDKLNSVASFPELSVFANFALKAYNERGNTKEQIEKYEKDLPQGWKFLTDCHSNNGYYGVAYWNPEYQQVIIAHRGTELYSNIGGLLESAKDIWADFQGVERNKYVSQMNSATTFAHTINEQLMFREHGVQFQLFFTGHSLGGWLAQITTFTTEYLKKQDSIFIKNPDHIIDEYHAHTVVFESPGCKEMLLQMESDFEIRSNHSSICIKDLDITSYLSAPNLINTSNQHVGKVYRILTDLSDLSDKTLYVKETHKMDKILNACILANKDNSKIEEVIEEVIDWPIRKKFGGKELDSFFKWASKFENYNPGKVFQKEYPDYSSIRYQTKEYNPKECSIYVFTQSEQKFLKKYQEVREFSEFFHLEKLFDSINNKSAQDEAQNALKTFIIENEIIKCESAENLQKFIPFIKIFLKLFNELKIIDNFSSPIEILKKFYQHKSRENLSGIRDSILEFDDSILTENLRSFLNDELKKVWRLVVKKDTHISLTKLYKIFQKIEFKDEDTEKIYKQEDSYLVLESDQLFRENKIFPLQKLFKLIDNNTHFLLIIEFKPIDAKEIYEEIKKVFIGLFEDLDQKRSNIKILLITQQDFDSTRIFTEICKDFYTETDDTEFTWKCLMGKSQEKILEKTVNFQGKTIILKELVSGRAENKNKIDELIDPDTLTKLVKNETVNIGCELLSLGYDETNYVPRLLNFKTKLKKEVLATEGIEDKFIISSNVQANLNRLVPNDSSRFILTQNNEQASGKFQEFCEDHVNVHWLKHEPTSDRFIWQKSKGSLSVLRQHIDYKNCTENYSEEDWLKNESNSKVVIISDSAGMGKSTILTHLSQQIKKDPANFDTWLIRINLGDLTNKFKNFKNQNIFKDEEINIVENILSKDLLKMNEFEHKLFMHSLFFMNGKSIIMFDGFDEISPNYKDIVISLLVSLRKTQIKQLWVTTRSNMRVNLEDELGQFACTLEPFSKENQKNFLTKFWAQKLGSSAIIEHEARLNTFASALILLLANSISDKDQEFTGIPLQTRMVAEAFEKDFKNFYYSKQLEPTLPLELNLFDLYEKFFRRKYEIDQEERNNLDFNRREIITKL